MVFSAEEHPRDQIMENGEADAIGTSSIGMYKVLVERRSTNPYDSRVEYVYPSINWLIHALRNSHTHRKVIERIGAA